MLRLFLLVCLAIFSWQAEARPVSYPGGWTAIQTNDADAHALTLHYTPSPRYSVGYLAEYWRGEDWQFHGGQLTYLLHRENLPSAQANLYLMGGAGLAYSDYQAFDGKTEPAGFLGVMADAETRRLFISYEAHAYEAGEIASLFQHKARFGIAPYEGDYGDLHTWLMLQIDHRPAADEPLTATPLVRFFYDVHLLEAGLSNRGDLLFNYTVRF